ncbi:MAG: peptide ABC transporter substrate-binding protein [Chloroflexi bacterium]|nr:peptide ABC transporter substrate-binding protein [Chloroflexota bacterium]
MESNHSASESIRLRQRVTRRQILRVGLGLAAIPLVAACGQSAPAPTQKTEAATGTLKMLLWQAPTILNPHLSQGTKDSIAARCCTEPLLTVDNEGKFAPVLASEVPSQQNGGLSADGKQVTYKLKPGVKWADGQPFTADDVAFTFQFINDPASAAVTAGTYANIATVEAVDPGTVKITFKEPTGGWYVPFVGTNGQILPKHAMKDFIGAKSREAPLNTKVFGTGPFMVDDFTPGDLVVYKANPNFRDASKLGFGRIEMKGGGDAVSAARSVFQTGEYDYAWNLQVEAPVLNDIMQGGKGDLVTAPGSGVEQVYMGFSDPTKSENDPDAKHPFLTDKVVRQAMALAIDKDTMAKQLYGPTGDATPNVLTTPSSLRSKDTKYEFSIDKANKLLDDAGYKRGGDGIRTTPSGVRMKVVLQTSQNSLRQKEQAIIKDGWQKIGIQTELKAVDAGVFFGSDPSNPDIFARFSTDTQMFTSTFDSPFPVGYMNRFYTGPDKPRTWATKDNKYSGRNFLHWQNDDFDKLWPQVLTELNAEKAAQDWQQLNAYVVNDYASIPLIDRKFSSAKAKGLSGPDLRAFDSETWNIGDWKKA